MNIFFNFKWVGITISVHKNSSDQCLFLLTPKSFKCWQIHSRLSYALNSGVASIQPLCHKGLIDGLMLKWL